MAIYSVLINGVERECLWEAFEIREAINRVTVMSGNFVSLDATFRPALGNDIVITEDAVRIFGGIVEFAEEAGFGGPAGIDIVTRINGVGYASYADRRFVNETIAAGTLKASLQAFEAYVSTYGVTLDAGQVDGPTLAEQAVSWRKGTDFLNDLSKLTTGVGGSPTDPPYLWEIDYFKELRMYQLGNQAAPVDVIEGDAVEVGDLVVTPTKQDYANRVILISSDGAVVTTVDDVAEQGTEGIWELVVRTPVVLTDAVALEAALGVLSQVSVPQTKARYHTISVGLHPGQMQTITSAKRNVNGSFVITEVTIRQEPRNAGMIREVVAIEGYRLGSSWQDIIQGWTVPPTGPAGPSVTIPAGTIFFSDWGGGQGKFYSPSGAVVPVPSGIDSRSAARAMIALRCPGSIAVCAADTPSFPTTGVGLIAANFRSTVDSAAGPDGPDDIYEQRGVGRDALDNFYVCGKSGGSNWIFKYTSGGVQTASFDLGATGTVTNLGVNAAGTVAYFCRATASVNHIVYAWDLTNDVSLGAFVTESPSAPGYSFCSDQAIIVLESGDVLVGWEVSAGDGHVAHYDSAGALVDRYDFGITPGADNISPNYLSNGINDTYFVANYFSDNAVTYSGSVVATVQVGSGTVLASFTPEDGFFDFSTSTVLLRKAVV